MKKYAVYQEGELIAFPVHATCVEAMRLDYPGLTAREITLSAHRRAEDCFHCGRLVCKVGNTPVSIDRAGNDWDFV
jgi:hypothetical protein